jgi:hypothetical protein
MNEEQEFLMSALFAAVKAVYEEKRSLLTYAKGDRKGLEQAFVFRTGLYLSGHLKGSEYELLDLDSEYNKNHGDPKKTINFPNGIRPDLIVHERDSNEKNKLVVEFKGYWDSGIDNDLMKLADLTSPHDQYQYAIGVLVIIGKANAEFRIFINGQEINGN